MTWLKAAERWNMWVNFLEERLTTDGAASGPVFWKEAGSSPPKEGGRVG